MPNNGHFPLSRIKVLDLTRARAGPTCVRQLVDWGAEAIKIEMPGGRAGDGMGGNRGGFDSDTPYRDTIGLLIGDGDIPTLDTYALDSTGNEWQASAGESFWMPLDITGESIEFITDTFANHLIHNTPLGDPSGGYRTPADMLSGANSSRISGGLLFDPVGGEGFNSVFAWRGPYINDRVDPDPWGNRYMANVFALFTPVGVTADGYGSAVVCYSAGPDEEIDTAFNQSGGWFTGDDDITALVSAGGSR